MTVKPTNNVLPLFLVLILISLNLRPALTSIAPLMELIVKDLSLNRATAGLVTTIPVLLMGLLAPLAPYLSARYTQERVLLGTMFVLTIALFVRAFSGNSVFVLLFSAFGTGSGIAIAGPLLSSFIKQHFKQKVGIALAVYSVSLTLGAALAISLTWPLTHLFNEHWEWALASWGLLALLTSIVMLILIQAPKKSQGVHKKIVPKMPITSTKAWLLTAFFAAQAGVFYSLASWLVAYYEQSGFSTIVASNLASVFMLSGIAGALCVPLLLSRIHDSRLLMALLTFSSTLLLFLITWQPHWFPWVVLFLLGVTSSGTFALSLSLPILESKSPEESASLSSMMSTFGYVIGGCMPFLIGFGVDVTSSFKIPFMMLAGLCSTMVIIAFLLPKPVKSNST